MRTLIPAVALVGLLSSASFAQPNVIPGTDVSLGALGTLSGLTHIGAFPNGEHAFAMSTTSCNLGTVNVPWLAPMQANHPFISFLVVREMDGRMVQISDRSWVKHGFFALSNSQCTPCQNPSNGTFLGVGCSDTYAVANNSDNNFLAPPDEINPWTGVWDPVCSFFDMGQPPVSAPANCNGQKSPITPVDTLGARVRISDQELNTPNSTFYFQSQYVIRGEPEANRNNNVGSRSFVPVWSGSKWNPSVPGTSTNPLIPGTVLARWTGATVTSVKNGNDDGRVYLAVVTKDLGNGITRYEYAAHNRDNARGIDEIRIPVCPGATITNFGFHDVDDSAANDWTFTRTGAEAVFTAAPGNALRWNSIYNIWFDCDAGPSANQNVVLAEADAGPGAETMLLTSTAPMQPALGSNLGFSTVGSNGLAPELAACGDLNTGSLGHFVLRFAPANAATFIFAGLAANPTALLDGFLVPVPVAIMYPAVTDSHGDLVITAPGGGGPFSVVIQFVIADAGKPQGYVFSNAANIPFGP